MHILPKLFNHDEQRLPELRRRTGAQAPPKERTQLTKSADGGRFN
jgi:hypothetical protein